MAEQRAELYWAGAGRCIDRWDQWLEVEVVDSRVLPAAQTLRSPKRVLLRIPVDEPIRGGVKLTS
jgi:hypothetical protein